MHQIKWKGYLQAAGLTKTRWTNMKFRDKALAFAFGDAPTDLPGGRYFDIDAAVTSIGLDLAPGLGLNVAMNLVRMTGEAALHAIAYADHADGEPVWYGIGEAMLPDGKAYTAGAGLLDGFAGSVIRRKGKEAEVERWTFVNVTSVLARVRANAAAAGMDLSDPFLPPPGSTLLGELMSAGRKMDEERLTAIRAELSQVTA